jgi:hypothetical protein
MSYVIKKVSDHGASNPIVARLGVQTNDVISFFNLPKEQHDRVLAIYINLVQPRLLHCMELYSSIAQEYETIRESIARDKIQIQADGRVIEVPQISRLTEQTEAYLYNAKSALRDLSLVFEPLFGLRFGHSRYHEIRGSFEKQFGPNTAVCNLLRNDGFWLKRVIDMRNAVEHPDGKRGPLHILNVELVGQAASPLFQVPVWFFEGEQPSGIVSDMQTMLDNLLTFAEDLLIAAYVQLHPTSIVQFTQIPEQDRDPKCPVRIMAVLDESKVKANNTKQPDRES